MSPSNSNGSKDHRIRYLILAARYFWDISKATAEEITEVKGISGRAEGSWQKQIRSEPGRLSLVFLDDALVRRTSYLLSIYLNLID